MTELASRPFRLPSSRRLRPAALLLLGLLGACSVVEMPTRQRGHRVEADVLKELVPGTSTKADVVALLGSPSKRATFDDDTWLYISSVTRLQIARKPGLEDQEVTVLNFTPQGTLKEITRLNQDDALPVQVVDRETPSPGNERTFLQQLFGNVARLNAGIPLGGGGGGRSTAGSAPTIGSQSQ